MKYDEVLTEQEIQNIVTQYLRADGSPDKTKDILDLLAFYGWCKIIFDGVVSGDFIITGMDENGLEYKLSEKARRRLH
jgi:hypothetical protein